MLAYTVYDTGATRYYTSYILLKFYTIARSIMHLRLILIDEKGWVSNSHSFPTYSMRRLFIY